MNLDGVHDPFTRQSGDRLDFLNTRSPMPSATLPMLRGSSRLFDPTHRAIANQAAELTEVAAQAETAGRVGPESPTPAVDQMPVATDLFGLDVTTLSVEQLGQLMTACATQMMRSIARSAEHLEL